MGGGYLVAIVLALAGQANAPPKDVDLAQKPGMDAAASAIQAKQPQAALDAITPVIAAYQAVYASEPRKTYCGMSTVETLAYMGEAASENRAAIAVGPGYCDALYLKGYALVDLGRLAEARAVYEQLLTLAPMHAHFIAELGQTYRYERNWPTMLELCQRALGYVDFAPQNVREADRRRAWRCIGYALTEQGKFDDAEAMYRKSLASDPSDTISQHELTYIADQRRKQGEAGKP